MFCEQIKILKVICIKLLRSHASTCICNSLIGFWLSILGRPIKHLVMSIIFVETLDYITEVLTQIMMAYRVHDLTSEYHFTS